MSRPVLAPAARDPRDVVARRDVVAGQASLTKIACNML